MSDDFDDDREYVEEQARNMRDVRLRREADDRRWREVRDTERARPIEQREHFLFAEAAERLARDPKNLTIDPELRERVIRDLFAWVENRQFTAEEVAIINVVWGGASSHLSWRPTRPWPPAPRRFYF